MARFSVRPVLVAATAVAGLAVAGFASAQQQQPLAVPPNYALLLAPLYSGNQTIIGQTIAYPTGTPKVTSAITTLAPGAETGWHLHEVPLYAYVLEGVVTIDYGPHGLRTIAAGAGFIEAVDVPHNGRNLGPGPVRILVVYFGAEGLANAIPANPPQ